MNALRKLAGFSTSNKVKNHCYRGISSEDQKGKKMCRSDIYNENDDRGVLRER